jgi:hypothetical protein
MKKLVIISAILLSFALACTKNSLSISTHDITGTWVLKNISGGFAGVNTTPTDHITISFETNSEYTSTVNYTTTATGKYTLTKAPEPNYYYSDTLLNLLSDSNQTTYGINLGNDSLVLAQPCCDQFQYLYIKLK